MKLHKKPTSDEMRKARQGGFKRKRPKKPKASAKLHSLEGWGERYNQWCKDVRAAGMNGKKEKDLRSQIRNL